MKKARREQNKKKMMAIQQATSNFQAQTISLNNSTGGLTSNHSKGITTMPTVCPPQTPLHTAPIHTAVAGAGTNVSTRSTTHTTVSRKNGDSKGGGGGGGGRGDHVFSASEEADMRAILCLADAEASLQASSTTSVHPPPAAGTVRDRNGNHQHNGFQPNAKKSKIQNNNKNNKDTKNQVNGSVVTKSTDGTVTTRFSSADLMRI